MTAKQYAGLVVILIGVFVAGFALRRPVDHASELQTTLREINKVLTTAEYAVNLWQGTSAELKALSSQNKAIKVALDESNAMILLLEENVLKLGKTALESKIEIDSLLAIVTGLDTPGDYVECLEQLGLAHDVIARQSNQITTLEGINQQQALIIERKDVVIELKDQQAQAYRQMMESYRLRARLTTWLGILGIAAAVAL